MTDRDDLRRDSEAALGDVDRLRRELLEFQELMEIEPVLREFEAQLASDLEEFRARVAELLDRIQRLLLQIGSGQTSRSGGGAAFSLSTLANELNAQLDWLQGMLAHLEGLVAGRTGNAPGWFTTKVAIPVRSALGKIKARLIPLLKRFLAKIWQIISGLLTPKEWKLKGQVGTGILGLADVGIEITFGP